MRVVKRRFLYFATELRGLERLWFVGLRLQDSVRFAGLSKRLHPRASFKFRLG